MKKENLIIFILIFLLAMFLFCLVINYDYDLFARLEVGEIFFKLHTVLKHDPFSYTPTLYWFDHEWGSGVMFYAFLKLFGSAGLIILNALLFSITIFLILRQNKKLTYPLLFGAFYLYVLNYEAGAVVKSQAFTFMFTALTLYILEKFKYENSKLIWILPLIIALWCNLHGGVAAGLGIISLYTVISIFQRKQNALKLIIVTLLSYSALLINPYGIRYLSYLFYTVTVPRTNIEDWLSVFNYRFFMRYLPIIILIILMLICKIYRSIQNKKFDVFEYILIAIIVPLSFLHLKNIPIATIIMFIFAGADVNYYLCKIKYIGILNKSLYLVIPILALSIPLTIFTPRASIYRFPIVEAEFLKINNIKGNVIAPFEDAGYISYKLFPNNKIFIDGRYDGVYPMSVFYDQMKFETLSDNWKDALEKYPTEIIIISRTEDVYKELKENKSLGWVEIFITPKRSIFVKQKNLKTSYKMPIHDINYYRNNLFKTEFVKYIKKENDD